MFRWTAAFLTLLAASAPSFGQDASNWIGHKVVTLAPTPLRVENREVKDDGLCRVFTVEKAKDGWLWLNGGHIRGWVPADRVVQLDQAVDYFTRVFDADPRNAGALERRGDAYFYLKERMKAFADYDTLIRLHPESSAGYACRGQVWLYEKKFAEALADFHEAIRLDPSNAFAYEGRGTTRLHSGDIPGAVADFTVAIGLVPDSPAPRCSRAGALYQLLQLDEALADCNEAIRLDPNYARGHAYEVRATIHTTNEQFPLALADAKERVRLDPKNAASHELLGEIRTFTQDYPGALVDLSEAIRLAPSFVDPYLSRGTVHAFLGEYEKSKRDFETACKIAPDDPDTLEALAWQLSTCPDAQFRDGPRAVSLATRACEIDHWKDPGRFEALATAYAETGDFSKAVEWQQKAVSQSPDEGARAEFQKLLTLFQRHEAFRNTSDRMETRRR